MKKRVQTGWSGWKKLSGVIWDKRVAAKVKEKVYKRVKGQQRWDVLEPKIGRPD